MVKILKSLEYGKLNYDQQHIIDKACMKLESMICEIGKDNFSKYIRNNPVIHDSYGNFFVYKFSTKSYSVRLLYTYNHGKLEVHRAHFKNGDRDNSKYIQDFELYTSRFSFV